MTKRNIIVSLLAVFLAFAGLGKAASAQTAEEIEVRRAKLIQIYLRSQGAVGDFMASQTAFNIARSKDNRDAMSEAAAAMFASSAAAAYWAVDLNERIKLEPVASDEARELSAELRELTTQTYRSMATIISTSDLDTLAKGLDDSSDQMNRMFHIARIFYDRLEALYK